MISDFPQRQSYTFLVKKYLVSMSNTDNSSSVDYDNKPKRTMEKENSLSDFSYE